MISRGVRARSDTGIAVAGVADRLIIFDSESNTFVSSVYLDYTPGGARGDCSITPDGRFGFATQIFLGEQVWVVDLEASQKLYGGLASDFDEGSYAGIANTCRGGIIEAEVVLKRRDPASALGAFVSGLDKVVDLNDCPFGGWLESYG